MNTALLVPAVLCLVSGLVATFELRRRLELVARAEHELRGPAAALSLACETIRREPAGRRHAAVLEAQLDRLRAGLADLEAARRGRRPAVADGLPVEIAETARAATRPWRDWIGDARFEWEGGPAPAVLDRGRLAQALGNMVANAAEHGAGDVEVRGRTTASAVRIEVRNRVVRDREGASGARPASPGARPASLGPRPAAPDARPALPGAMLDRGRGLAIASQAARDLGGRLLMSLDGESAVAVLELPLRALEPSAGPGGAETA